MIKWLMRRAIDKFGREWNYDTTYMREILDVSPRAAWLMTRIEKFGQFRRDIPLAPWAAAGITAVKHEDCGPCTQLAVGMAERAGVPPDVLRAIVSEDVAAMPEDVALAWRFTRATLARDPAADAHRREIQRRWGAGALVSLAYAMAAARVYPTVKYAMGHGQTCVRVVVAGTPIQFGSPDSAVVRTS